MSLKMLLSSFRLNQEEEAGCDEAGRGCLAGPVVAASVILDPKKSIEALNDSKKLSANQRAKLAIEIREKALAYAIGFVSNTEIDEINILNASFLAMHRAIEKLKLTPKLLLIDGNRFNPYPKIPHECIIKGDAKYMSIAAASILAKTARDAYMEKLHLEYDCYGWDTNAGYPTKKHRDAIRQFGDSPHHRKSFKLLPEQLKLF
jgi:ribonuclease HII